MKLSEAIDQMDHAIRGERLAQAYIVEAPTRPMGIPFAERLLGALYCERRGVPCGECAACKRLLHRTHPDVLWIEPQKKSRQIPIAEVRALQQRVYQTAYMQGWKVVVLLDAERLNVQASNAFLKTLEEPPPRTLFLLLTVNPNELLPTIASRCQSLKIEGDLETLDTWQVSLLDLLAEEGQGAGAARHARVGPLTLALARSERMSALFKQMKDTVESEVEAATEGEDLEKEAFEARVSARYREKRTGLMKTMLLWYRDMLLVGLGLEDSMLHYPDRRGAMQPHAAALGERALLQCVAIVEKMQSRLDRNLQENVVFGAGFASMAQLGAAAVGRR